ncbi:hypothetical protein ES703_109429 [subsurface metagenome]
MVSVPAAAPGWPPLTGQSMTSIPFSSRAAATSIMIERIIVAVQITVAPGLIPSSNPCFPNTNSLTWAPFNTMMNTTSDCSPTCWGDLEIPAPKPAISPRGSSRRSYTVSLKPFFTRFLAMPMPMLPKPITPTLSTPFLPKCSTYVSRPARIRSMTTLAAPIQTAFSPRAEIASSGTPRSSAYTPSAMVLCTSLKKGS